MPRNHYDYERLAHHQLLDVGQDKLLLLFDLGFADYERMPTEEREARDAEVADDPFAAAPGGRRLPAPDLHPPRARAALGAPAAAR